MCDLRHGEHGGGQPEVVEGYFPDVEYYVLWCCWLYIAARDEKRGVRGCGRDAHGTEEGFVAVSRALCI